MSAHPPPRVGIIMLAAGVSRRFGADKRQALLPDGRGLLDASLEAVPPAFDLRLLVLRPGDEALAALFREHGWESLLAADAGLGMGHSLAAGIRAARDWEGALIALADMPFIQARTYLRLAQALTRHDIAVPVHRGRRGHPVGFRRSLFGELASLAGDRGARALLERHGDRCHELEVEDAGVLRDIDTPAALTGK